MPIAGCGKPRPNIRHRLGSRHYDVIDPKHLLDTQLCGDKSVPVHLFTLPCKECAVKIGVIW